MSKRYRLYPFISLFLLLLLSCGGGGNSSLTPTVIKTDPNNKATGVPVQAPINATFSYSVDPVTVNGNTFIVSGAAGTISYQDQTATFTPSAPLAKGQTYSAILTNGVKDLDGISLPGNYTWSFTTEGGADTTPPIIETTVPAANVTGVSTTAPIAVVFSEAIDPATVNAQTFFVNNGVIGDISYADSDQGHVAQLTPKSLKLNTTYIVTVTKGVKDLAGNPLAVDLTWSFTTAGQADQTPPGVTSQSPANNAGNVSVSTNVIVTFDEEINPDTILSNFVLQAGGVDVPAAPIVYTRGQKTAALTPSSALASNTKYVAIVKAGVKDLSGNTTTSPTVWSFTTGIVADTTPPTVVSHQPTSGQTGVNVRDAITVTFSEPLQPASVTKQGSFKLTRGSANVTGQVDYDANTLTATIHPAEPRIDKPGQQLDRLIYNTTYTLVASGGIQDLAGNGLTAVSWTFTTTDAPHVVSSFPADKQIDVPLDPVITVSFSRSMDQSTIDQNHFNVRIAGFNRPDGPPLSGNVTYNPQVAPPVASFSPDAALSPDTVYKVSLTEDIQDSLRNPLDSPSVWFFTTGHSPPLPDTTPPTVTNTSPADGVLGVSVTTPIVVTFSEAINPDTVNSLTFFVNGVEGSVTYDNSGTNQATLTHTAPLAAGTSNTVHLTTVIQDLAGNSLIEKTWSFTTAAAPDTTPPTVLSTNPSDNNTQPIPVPAKITATFSEAITQGTVNAQTFLINDVTRNVAVTGDISYDPGTGLATFVPSPPLTNSITYSVTLTTGIQDLATNPLVQKTWSFTTVDATPPDGTSPAVATISPPDNATRVQADTVVSVVFTEMINHQSVNAETFQVKPVKGRGGGRDKPAVAGSYCGADTHGGCRKNIDSRMFIFTPASPFELDTLYQIILKNGITDLFGNPLSGYNGNFRTAPLD